MGIDHFSANMGTCELTDLAIGLLNLINILLNLGREIERTYILVTRSFLQCREGGTRVAVVIKCDWM